MIATVRDILRRAFGRTDRPSGVIIDLRPDRPDILLPMPPSASDDDSGPSGATPAAVPDRPAAGLTVLTPSEHAVRFLAWLQDASFVAPSVAHACGATGAVAGATGDILARDLAEMHGEMCLDLGVEQVRWALVSSHFRQLVGDRKRYVWHRDLPDSKPQRLCVVHVPALRSPGPVAVPWPDLPMRQAA